MPRGRKRKVVEDRGPVVGALYQIGEKVLCYEPDPSKTKVLYDAKIIEIKCRFVRRKMNFDYKVHFQGWKTSWDRFVDTKLILKNTDENIELQEKLLEKNKLTAEGSSKKNNKSGRAVAGTSDPPPTGPENAAAADRGVRISRHQIMSSSLLSEEEEIDDEEKEARESVLKSFKVPAFLLQKMEHDEHTILNTNMMVRLPAKYNIVFILEEFLRSFAKDVLTGWANDHSNLVPQNTSSINISVQSATGFEPEEEENPVKAALYMRVFRRIGLMKESVDGIRVYCDQFIDKCLRDREIDHHRKPRDYPVSQPRTPEPFVLPEMFTAPPPQARDRMRERDLTMARLTRLTTMANPDVALVHDANLKFPRASGALPVSKSSLVPAFMEFKNEIETKFLLLNDWKLIPEIQAEGLYKPSMVCGVVHLVRVVAIMDDLLAHTTIPSGSLRTVVRHLHLFMEFLCKKPEYFEDNYVAYSLTPDTAFLPFWLKNDYVAGSRRVPTDQTLAKQPTEEDVALYNRKANIRLTKRVTNEEVMNDELKEKLSRVTMENYRQMLDYYAMKKVFIKYHANVRITYEEWCLVVRNIVLFSKIFPNGYPKKLPQYVPTSSDEDDEDEHEDEEMADEDGERETTSEEFSWEDYEDAREVVEVLASLHSDSDESDSDSDDDDNNDDEEDGSSESSSSDSDDSDDSDSDDGIPLDSDLFTFKAHNERAERRAQVLRRKIIAIKIKQAKKRALKRLAKICSYFNIEDDDDEKTNDQVDQQDVTKAPKQPAQQPREKKSAKSISNPKIVQPEKEKPSTSAAVNAAPSKPIDDFVFAVPLRPAPKSKTAFFDVEPDTATYLAPPSPPKPSTSASARAMAASASANNRAYTKYNSTSNALSPPKPSTSASARAMAAIVSANNSTNTTSKGTSNSSSVPKTSTSAFARVMAAIVSTHNYTKITRKGSTNSSSVPMPSTSTLARAMAVVASVSRSTMNGTSSASNTSRSSTADTNVTGSRNSTGTTTSNMANRASPSMESSISSTSNTVLSSNTAAARPVRTNTIIGTTRTSNPQQITALNSPRTTKGVLGERDTNARSTISRSSTRQNAAQTPVATIRIPTARVQVPVSPVRASPPVPTNIVPVPSLSRHVEIEVPGYRVCPSMNFGHPPAETVARRAAGAALTRGISEPHLELPRRAPRMSNIYDLDPAKIVLHVTSTVRPNTIYAANNDSNNNLQGIVALDDDCVIVAEKPARVGRRSASSSPEKRAEHPEVLEERIIQRNVANMKDEEADGPNTTNANVGIKRRLRNSLDRDEVLMTLEFKREREDNTIGRTLRSGKSFDGHHSVKHEPRTTKSDGSRRNPVREAAIRTKEKEQNLTPRSTRSTTSTKSNVSASAKPSAKSEVVGINISEWETFTPRSTKSTSSSPVRHRKEYPSISSVRTRVSKRASRSPRSEAGSKGKRLSSLVMNFVEVKEVEDIPVRVTRSRSIASPNYSKETHSNSDAGSFTRTRMQP